MSRIFIIGLLLLSTFVFAEEAMEADEKETTEEKQNNESKGNNALEEFVPSEEVSIDKPVAFPVDI